MTADTGRPKPWGSRPRRGVDMDRGPRVVEESIAPQQSLPPVYRATVGDLNPVPWVRQHRAELEDLLRKDGAILLRGFAVADPARFQEVIEAASGDAALEYRERSSPRSTVKGNVYTSTDHPSAQSIFLHNEQSYNLTFPRKIFFCCLQPAEDGGATPIADCRGVLRELDPDLVRRFTERGGYMYVRNFGGGLGLTWQDAFQTDDPQEVERYCADHDIEWEWRGEGRLRTRQVRPVVVRHPVTGERVWFNHLTFFHVTTLPEALRRGLEGVADGDLPNNTYYGDGSPIEDEVLERLRELYAAATRRFTWQRGDVLMLDNVIVAHGRDPFAGERSVVVGMAEPYHHRDVAVQGNEGGRDDG